MALYLASDMHLRPDRPDRGARVARWVNRLSASDELILVGDVCDFWFASRGRLAHPLEDTGLRALLAYRQRAGALRILPGNHDRWLGAFYRECLGAEFIEAEHLDLSAHGLRLRLYHGHTIAPKSLVKHAMETQAFRAAFGAVPEPIALLLQGGLMGANTASLAARHRRMLAVYAEHATTLADRFDLVVFGHVHERVDEAAGSPRWVVLGDWIRSASYLRVDEQGAEFVIELDTPVTITPK